MVVTRHSTGRVGRAEAILATLMLDSCSFIGIMAPLCEVTWGTTSNVIVATGKGIATFLGLGPEASMACGVTLRTAVSSFGVLLLFLWVESLFDARAKKSRRRLPSRSVRSFR